MVLWPGSGETAESFLPIRLWVCWLGPWNFKVQNANKYPSLKNIRKPVSKDALNLLFPRAPLRTQVRPCPCCMLPWRQPDHPPCFHLHPESLTPWETNQTHLANQFCIKMWKWKLHLTLCYPMGCWVYGILQARILEWVSCPFSRGSSQPRDWTQVTYIAVGFLTSWATREAQEYWTG